MTNFSNDFGRNQNKERTPTRETSSQENEIRNMPRDRDERTLQDNMEILTGEMNFRISQEMNSIINGMNSQIERAISSAISERIIPQMQNVVENVLARELREVPNVSSRLHVQTDEAQNSNRDNLRDLDPSSDLNRMETEEVSPHMVTGAFEPQTSVPEFLTGRTHSQPILSRQESVNNVDLDTTLPVPDNTPATAQDPINRLADVLVNLQNKPQNQSLTIRPVNTTTMTFDGKSEKFELFEDLFHTMIKMQPEMTKQMKINHFHSLLRKNALQTFRNINTANRQTLEDVLVIFRRKYSKPSPKQLPNINGTGSLSIPIQ